MNKEIAKAFSNGEFEQNYKHLAEDIEWSIFGENLLHAKDSVIKHCDQVARYFQSVSTHFDTYTVFENSSSIAVNGKAVFRRGQEEVATVNSCDIYEFNEKGQIQNIKSYCITEKK